MTPCKWCRNGVCTNDACPACADYCPLDCWEGDRWEMCRYYEKEDTCE